MKHQFITRLTGLLFAVLSAFSCYSQNTYNSIAELVSHPEEDNKQVILNTKLTIVALAESYMLLTDENNDMILLRYWQNVGANDFTIGSRYQKYQGFYYKQTDYDPNHIGHYNVPSGLEEEEKIDVVPESSLPQPENIADNKKTIDASMRYIKLRGSVTYDNGKSAYQIAYGGKNYPISGLEIDEPGIYEIIGYVGSSDLTIYAYSKYPAERLETTVSVSVNCDPTEGGKAWIGDTESTISVEVSAGESITLHAVANSGYNFTGWKKDDVVVSRDMDYDITVESAAEYTACFEAVASRYTLTVNADAGGSASIEGTTELSAEFDDGKEVTVTAKAGDGYDFTGWSDGSEIVSNQTTYTFNISKDMMLTATFAKIAPSECTLAEYLATANPSGEYTLAGSYTVVATATDFIFISDGNNVLKCEYLGAGNNVNVECPYGSTVVGVTFTVYSDGIKTYARLNALPTVVSQVEIENIPFINTDMESVGEKVGKYVEIANVKIKKVNSATTSTYYIYVQQPSYQEFILETDYFKTSAEPTSSDHWTVRGVLDYFKTEKGWEPAFYADFVKTTAEVPVTYTLTLASSEGGSAWIGDDKTKKSGNYTPGTEVTINAEAAEGYTFKNWRNGAESIGTDNPMRYTVTENAELEAVFEKNAPVIPPAKTRKITISSANPDKGSVRADEFDGLEAETDQSVTIHAIPATDNDFFKNWSDGNGFSTTNPYVYDGEEDLALTAYFISRYKVNFAAPDNSAMTIVNSKTGATLHSGDRVDEGDEILVVLTPAAGYVVETITANGVAVGHTSSAVRIAVDSEVTIAATVMPEVIGEIQLSVVSSNPEMGIAYINAPGTTSVNLRRGESAVCHAEPVEGCKFDGWREVGTAIIKSQESVYTLGFQSGDVHLEAVFSYIVQTPFTVTVKSSNPAKGSVSIEGEDDTSVTTRNAVTVIATPAGEYDYFVDWTDEHNVVLSDKAEYTYTATQSVVLTANFRSHYPVTFSYEGNGAISVADEAGAAMESGAVCDEGSRISVVAVADAHHFVESVSVNGADVTEVFMQNDSRYSTAIVKPTDIKVVFSPDMHTLSIEAVPHGTVRVYREIGSDGAGVGSPLSHGDRVPYGSTLYIFASADEGYTMEGVMVNGTKSLPEAGAAHIVHKVEGDVSIKPVYGYVSGIDAILPEGTEIEAVYNLRGTYLGKLMPEAPGIYIVRAGGRTFKVAVPAQR